MEGGHDQFEEVDRGGIGDDNLVRFSSDDLGDFRPDFFGQVKPGFVPGLDEPAAPLPADHLIGPCQAGLGQSAQGVAIDIN